MAFLKAVLAGTLAAVLVPWLMAIGLAYDNSQGGLPLVRAMSLIAAVALVVVTIAAVLTGIPFAAALRRLRAETTQAYCIGGAIAGYVFVAGAFGLLTQSWPPASICVVGGFSGGVTAYTWWRLRRPDPNQHARCVQGLWSHRPRRLRERARSTGRGVQTWSSKSAPSGDIAISPLAFVMGLVVLGLAMVVALAGSGRLDWLPSQQYFSPELSRRTPVVCEDSDGARIDRFSALSDFEADWYSTHLRAARESSLYLESQRPASRGGQSYRFTWLRSFHEPVVIRVDRLPSSEMRLTAKRLSGYGGYGPGRIVARIDRLLSRDEAAEFERTLSAGRVLDLAPRDCRGGGDGANWIFEANDRGSYRYLMRWTPKQGAVRDTGMLLMSFTGWRFQPVY